MLIASAVVVLRTRVLPVWFGYVSLVVALLMLVLVGPIGFIAIVLGLPLWVLVASVLLRSGRGGFDEEPLAAEAGTRR
jgi:hypothetical protein